jgi:hypothetical protein
MILLLPNAATSGQWDAVAAVINQKGKFVLRPSGEIEIQEADNTDARGIDAALTQLLKRYAIDPSKIAIMGSAFGGAYALLLGRTNPDVFSRVVALSPMFALYGEGPKTAKPMFFISGRNFSLTAQLRQQGYAVEQVAVVPGGSRATARPGADPNNTWNDASWPWLATSWGGTSMNAEGQERLPRNVARTLADTDPVLTIEAFVRMTLFWSTFAGASDSAPPRGLDAYRERVTLTVNQAPVTSTMVNIPALAHQDPVVAAALTNAGLTAAQEEAYRIALIRVYFAQQAGTNIGSIAKGSVLGQNLEFGKTHKAEFDMLANTGVWEIQ